MKTTMAQAMRMELADVVSDCLGGQGQVVQVPPSATPAELT